MKKLITILSLLSATLCFSATTEEVIKELEGFVPTVYKDVAGKPTIGYGFTDKKSIAMKFMTRNQAEAILKSKVAQMREQLHKVTGSDYLTVQEEAAVLSFIYNVGWSAFESSTMCRLIREKAPKQQIAAEFPRWKYITVEGKKVVSNGLVNRRQKEMNQFLFGSPKTCAR